MLKRLVCAPVRFYRRFISPHTSPACRFTPTCSQYCIEAVEEWGVIRGLGLSIWRILRCNPWCRGGEDPVPQRKRKKNNKNERN